MQLTWIRSSYFCLDYGSSPLHSEKLPSHTSYAPLRCIALNRVLILFVLPDMLTGEDLVATLADGQNAKLDKKTLEEMVVHVVSRSSAYIYVFFVRTRDLVACSPPSAFTCNECSIAFLM